ncbi:DUF423 domain-containing protein [Ilyomonas limi]|uniref:DUF423 domain-containing protein n=1 Tax=Ilyomonas limi TaxID=2575867 RepID=A0A4U3L2H4_9BACT|nr:DUF423 domain-containing protein [Ilyomonas limi]TKK67746.1 DUF423 domain-containing protein [Ilyomonas limi]
MLNSFLRIAGYLGALSVILGAFGAHALKSMVPPKALEIFETGVRYQFYHVFALALAGILYQFFPNKLMYWSGNCFIIGIILFSGSLYLLTYASATDSAAFRWVGPITPLGGLLLIAGWILLALGIR